ncbi:RNA polymerase sigma-I factor [Niallia taxi]|uniref:RNA polymerase sigma-I factor n=1 Tax=Niallia taxi TaxID=2499688 RepID=UPI0015F5C28C|nr:RNA polymerase sigma-I factor [Niallia taxi]
MISLKSILPKRKVVEPEIPAIESLVIQAKVDLQIRNDLLLDYQPFILKAASKASKRYVSQSHDEFSVALEGFNEAIDQYEVDNKYGFLSFASMVIRRRVIDFIRKEIRQTRDIYLDGNFTDDGEEGFVESPAQIKGSLDEFNRTIEQEETVNEIEDFEQALSRYDISLYQLVELSPKHQDARENAKQIAKTIAENNELLDYLNEKQQLPIKQLVEMVSCSRKTIERNRKYIIALTLIHVGGYSNLKEFIEPRE